MKFKRGRYHIMKSFVGHIKNHSFGPETDKVALRGSKQGSGVIRFAFRKMPLAVGSKEPRSQTSRLVELIQQRLTDEFISSLVADEPHHKVICRIILNLLPIQVFGISWFPNSTPNCSFHFSVDFLSTCGTALASGDLH